MCFLHKSDLRVSCYRNNRGNCENFFFFNPKQSLLLIPQYTLHKLCWLSVTKFKFNFLLILFLYPSRSVSRAVEYEVWRQINLIEDGEIVENETRKKNRIFFYFLNCSFELWPTGLQTKNETLITTWNPYDDLKIESY